MFDWALNMPLDITASTAQKMNFLEAGLSRGWFDPK